VVSQSPSLRGSGRFALIIALIRFEGFLSQSPSLRGSGRFLSAALRRQAPTSGLNPLHCGAVVASGFASSRYEAYASLNPLHCGAVVASIAPRRMAEGQGGKSQSPSLRGSGRFFFRRRRAASRRISSQSPSLRGSGRFTHAQRRFSRRRWRLNPLHCGAVVASAADVSMDGRRGEVSIPFIAGQWSLQVSPPPPLPTTRVSIPFIAGQWSLRVEAINDLRLLARVSIPFIAGQWSLRRIHAMRRSRSCSSQSPSLRGSGRFPGCCPPWTKPPPASQSPSLRGSGRFSWRR